MNQTALRALLAEKQDLSYKQFNDRIVNCRTANPSLGVRLPALRAIAKQAAKDAPESLLDELLSTDIRTLFQEEHMLAGMLIGLAAFDTDTRRHYLDRWIPDILSWGDCDTGCAAFRFMRENRSFWFDYCCAWLNRTDEFPLRFALVALMDHFLTDEYIDRVLSVYAVNYSDAYYVKMGQAWALSACYAAFPEKTLHLLKNNRLDPWTHNKAIQKCRESLRVSASDKEMLKQLKKHAV